jgi:hypothetical protein
MGFGVLAFVFFAIGEQSIDPILKLAASDKCAADPKRYNVTHAYDCAKFTPGSLAGHCANAQRAYNLISIAVRNLYSRHDIQI